LKLPVNSKSHGAKFILTNNQKTKNDMEVTFVIPTYNSSKYICTLLESIANEAKEITYEIVIVDDCSDDFENLMMVVHHYNNVRIIRKKYKTNASHSRHLGVLKAAYKLVHFIDSDDFLVNGLLIHKIHTLENSDADFLISDFIENGNLVASNFKFNLMINADGRELIFGQGNDIRSSTILIKKNNFNGITFDQSVEKHQDWDFFIASLDRGLKFIHFKKASVNMPGANSNNMSSKLNLKASILFISKFGLNERQSSNFAWRHLKRSLIVSDYEAYAYFSKLLKLDSIGMKTKIFYLLTFVIPSKISFKILRIVARI
jgi:glycosyltransferase involved in cell wall biosynthesis